MADDKPQEQIRVEDKLVGPAEICDWLGISMKSFTHLAETRVAVPITRGKYLLKATVRACYERAIKSAAGRDSATGKARSELLTIQAKRAQFAMERETGGWVREADVCADVTEVFRIARNGMLRIPHRIAQDMPHLTRSDMTRIEDSTRAVLTELGAEGERIVKEIENAKQTALETGGSHGAPRDAQHASGRTRRRSRG
jgi:phage terminase Nu1 subunit (DNA packaging protein)